MCSTKTAKQLVFLASKGFLPSAIDGDISIKISQRDYNVLMKFTIGDLLIICAFVGLGIWMNLCPVSKTSIAHGLYDYQVTGFGWPFKSWVRWETPTLRPDVDNRVALPRPFIGSERPSKVFLPALLNNIAICLLITVIVLTVKWNVQSRQQM